MARPPRIPMRLALDQEVIYFITLCVAQRRSVLHTAIVFGSIHDFCVSHSQWITHALVVMPDHIHALISPLNREAKVTQFSAGLKRAIKRKVGEEWQWQHGVFDRLLRRKESAYQKWIYMRENPVRAGWVKSWEQWPYFINFH